MEIVEAYLTARERVVKLGYGPEIDWQDSRDVEHLSESCFLREAAWVILSAGMAERVVRGVFEAISEAFLHWRSAADILARQSRCVADSMLVFAHRRKLAAIVSAAAIVNAEGFGSFISRMKLHGPAALTVLDYVGPITCLHLAKNVGMEVAKPDRHLVRVARASGMNSPCELCQTIAAFTGDRVATVDLVIWRYATLDKDYLSLFADCKTKIPQASILCNPEAASTS